MRESDDDQGGENAKPDAIKVAEEALARRRASTDDGLGTAQIANSSG